MVWLKDMYSDVYERKVELEQELEKDDIKFEERRDISKKLRSIYKALGEGESVDPEDALIDKWEKELAEGLTPDLDEN